MLSADGAVKWPPSTRWAPVRRSSWPRILAKLAPWDVGAMTWEPTPQPHAARALQGGAGGDQQHLDGQVE